MGETSSDFRDSLLELVDATRPEPADHPSPEQWIAYHRGELAPGEEARLQEHLVRCRDCFDLAQAADAFAGPEEEPGAGEALAAAALWRELRPRLGPPSGPPPGDRLDGSPGGQVRAISDRPPPRSANSAEGAYVGWRLRPSYRLAASLLALAGMTAWSLYLQSRVAELRAPRPDVPIVEFAGGERLPGLEAVTLAAGSAPWTLVFHPAEERPVYRLAVRDSATGRELLAEELRPDADFALRLHLPEGLPAGRYRLELADGSGRGAGNVPETFLLRVTGEDGGV
jgi:Putative zinc-finger